MDRGKEVIKKIISPIRRRYIIRLVLRIFIFLIVLALFFRDRSQFQILYGWNFFKEFSAFHLLWIVWMFDMLAQLFPIRKEIALGSKKVFSHTFRGAEKVFTKETIKKEIVATTKSAYLVLIIWAAFIVALQLLDMHGFINDDILLLISVAFYVCDLICVLVWCPFRLIMKNKCCTTCRIFNWDHLMMFTPLITVCGFFSISLLLMALAVWIVWELCVLIYPERFWEGTNEALACRNCTDKLCTQYCQKLRTK